MTLNKWFSTGTDILPREHSITTRDILVLMTGEMVLLVSSGQRPGTLLNFLQCRGHAHTKLNFPGLIQKCQVRETVHNFSDVWISQDISAIIHALVLWQPNCLLTTNLHVLPLSFLTSNADLSLEVQVQYTRVMDQHT